MELRATSFQVHHGTGDFFETVLQVMAFRSRSWLSRSIYVCVKFDLFPPVEVNFKHKKSACSMTTTRLGKTFMSPKLNNL